jgi:hypothetical protein
MTATRIKSLPDIPIPEVKKVIFIFNKYLFLLEINKN